MAKFTLPSYLVVPDTNIIFTPNMTMFANSTFEEHWKQGAQLSGLRLLLPEIVAEEIVFRRHWAACRANENAAKSLSHIAAVTKTKAPKLKTEQQLKQRIRVAFGDWVSGHSGQIAKTPISRIKWRELITSAAWRLPPFSAYSQEKPDGEKGFRDALVLETFLDIVRRHPEQHLAILTGDGLLREATEPKIKERPTVAIYGTIAELVSSLTLLSKSLAEEFVKEIVGRAAAVFYSANDANALYQTADVHGKIRQKFGDELDKPVEEPASIGDIVWPALMQLSHMVLQRQPERVLVEPEYRPISDEKILIGPTTFKESKGNRYSWKSQIEFGRMFCDERMRRMGQSFLGTKLRVAKFQIEWSADISAEAVFSNWRLDDIKRVKQKLELGLLFERERFGFDSDISKAPSLPQQT